MIFGVHAGLQYTSADEIRALWTRIEQLGFEWISVWDHFYAADVTDPEPGYQCLEGLTAHAALAMATSTVRCGSLVYCAGYRHPAVLAKSIATIDNFSGGRVTLGLGAGWHQGEFDAYGIPFPPAPVRLRQLEEQLLCIRALFTEEVVDFEGEFYRLRAARCVPKPDQQHLPLWVGGQGERVTLKLVARHADGWNAPFVSVDTFRHKRGVLEAHCADADRDPADITRSLNLALAWREEDLRAQFGNTAEFMRGSVLTGTTQDVVDRIGEYADAGADQVNVAMRAPFDVAGLERFAAEVLPQFR
ncbi:MAG TPA: TIGR03560 family F420-dependent LLM class oxidoreductase [Acidimicrobiia bacterium]|nr:TIGR03560 family F420-dependent LLM class oxidoreductase [Acidimicrobiia bacterium]